MIIIAIFNIRVLVFCLLCNGYPCACTRGKVIGSAVVVIIDYTTRALRAHTLCAPNTLHLHVINTFVQFGHNNYYIYAVDDLYLHVTGQCAHEHKACTITVATMANKILYL